MPTQAALTRALARLTRALAPPVRIYAPLRVDGMVAGWVREDRLPRVTGFPDVFAVDRAGIAFVPALRTPAARTAAMAHVATRLASEGALTAWRDERYAAAPDLGAPAWFMVERAAARYFGLRTWAAHVNGLVDRSEGCAMWLARRSATKAIDPGLLDNLVGGGIGAGATVAGTVVKEAWEEAGIVATIAAHARPSGRLHVRRDQPDGLQWETIFTHDLWLPEDFVPDNQDGEAVEHRRETLPAIAVILGNEEGQDVMTADASLVALDALVRHRAQDDAAAWRMRVAALAAATA